MNLRVLRVHRGGWVLSLLGGDSEIRSGFVDLHDTRVTVDDHPVARLDDLQRVLVEGGDARDSHHDRAQGDLRRHLVEDHRLGRGPCEARDVKHRRPAG